MEEYYNDLMILRTQFELEGVYDETTIIKESKYLLMDLGVENEDEINNIIKGFYSNCGYDMPLETIKSVKAVNITNDLFNIIMSRVFDPNNPQSFNPGQVGAGDFTMPINPNNVLSTIPEEKENNDDSSSEESPQEGTSAPAMISSAAPNSTTPLNLASTAGLQLMLNMLTQFEQTLTNPPNLEEDNVIVTLDDEEFDKIKVSIAQETLETPCMICCCEIEKENEMSELPCKHTFHTECINPWLKEHSNKCPVCRQECGKAKYSNV